MEKFDLAPAEWNIMECLWERAPQTGRELTEQLEASMGWSRSTTLTLLRRMVGKGVVTCDTEGTKNTFSPAAPLFFFVQNLFAGSELLHAVRADVLASVVFDISAVAAEDAGRLILLENNGFAIDIDFDSVLLCDVERAAQFDGQNDSAELVDLSDDTCGFHCE